MQNHNDDFINDNSFNISNILMTEHNFYKECIKQTTVYDSLADLAQIQPVIIEAKAELSKFFLKTSRYIRALFEAPSHYFLMPVLILALYGCSPETPPPTTPVKPPTVEPISSPAQ